MGEGGRITLINSTNSDWKKTGQHSYQMNSWNFPDEIKSKTSVVVYVEWNTLVLDKSDDAGEVYYALDGTSYSFQIQARADNGFNLQFYLENIQSAIQCQRIYNFFWLETRWLCFFCIIRKGWKLLIYRNEWRHMDGKESASFRL